MALIDKTSIGTGNTIQAEHITRIIDALNESGSYEIIATGSFTGSFTGDGSGLTGVTVTSTPSATSASYAVTASHALYAVSASYEINYETSSSYADFAKTASYVKTAQTASYINVSNIAGEIIATTASYVTTAQTASYINATNIDGTVALSTSASYALTSSYIELAQTASYVETAQTASYVLGSNVSGTVATATSSSYSTDAKQLTGTTRTVYTFTTTNATPYNILVGDWLPGSEAARYIKAIVVARSGEETLGGVITKVIAIRFRPGGPVYDTIFTDGSISENFIVIEGNPGPTFNVAFEACQAIGLASTTINWKVIIEYFQL